MKPILFSTPMVQAILDGRKTMTRRAMTPQPLFKTHRKFVFADETCPKKWEDCDDITKTYKYQPGDILWVRETWADLRGMGFGNEPQTDKPWNYAFRADTKPGSDGDRARIDYGVKWRPSIFMPREASRIFLRVTDVRVERVRDITAEDVQKEGLDAERPTKEAIEKYSEGSDEMISILNWCKTYSQFIFKNLWDSINAKRGYGWDANPFVWVISFERITKDEAMQ